MIMNPYKNLPDNAFWKFAVANKNMFDISGLWSPKILLEHHHKVATFGSCFAQHIGNSLVQNNFSWLITESVPFGLSMQNIKRFNYNVFTCRTGNIYTTSLLRQWVEWALEEKNPAEEHWGDNNQIIDPFRPNIEPNGFYSKEEMISSRAKALSSFRCALLEANVFIFTLGLTESWFNLKHAYEYPMCPGTVGGEFDETQHSFKNQSFSFIKDNLEKAIFMMRTINQNLRIILTVSPVPLTATNSGHHVLIATMGSKSVLRSVAGQMAEEYEFIDYFPSYEIINSPSFRGVFFEPNLRTVNQHGVDFVMKSFLSCMNNKFPLIHENHPEASDQNMQLGKNTISIDEVACEELLLEAMKK